MKTAVLGSGLMGSVIAWDLARSADVDQVVVADMNPERLARTRRMTATKKLTTDVVDVKDRRRTVDFLREFDVVASALPHGTVNLANRAAVEARTKMVDIAFEDEQMGLAAAAKKRGALLIPGCGLAPGLAGILLANGARMLDEAVEGHIFVGGLPQHPKPPLGYRLVFSMVGLLREYLEDARIVRDGKIVRVKPFDTLGKVIFSAPIGKCEEFCTDGLAMVDYYDRKEKITSMGKATGFPCSIVTRMVGNGEVQGVGVVPPEVALNAKLVQKLHSELQAKGVKITENQNFASVRF